MRIVATVFLMPLLVFTVQHERGKIKAESESVLGLYDLSSKPRAQFKLPSRLNEASGLVMTEEGKLFSHDDERGVVYQLDYTSGRVIKQFSLGRVGVKADFEDIAARGKLLYLVESNGTIYEFPEGNDRDHVEFRTYRTFLSSKNDVEGLCYDPATDCLLLLCKAYPGKGYGKYKAVYEFSFKTKSLNAKPRFLIPLKEVTRTTDDNQFNPSGIVRHPESGTFFVIAAHGHSVVEVSPEGKVLAQQRINRKVNSHPEGIAFAPDHSLLLCNDGQGGTGTLTVYSVRK